MELAVEGRAEALLVELLEGPALIHGSVGTIASNSGLARVTEADEASAEGIVVEAWVLVRAMEGMGAAANLVAAAVMDPWMLLLAMLQARVAASCPQAGGPEAVYSGAGAVVGVALRQFGKVAVAAAAAVLGHDAMLILLGRCCCCCSSEARNLVLPSVSGAMRTVR